jgi:hypothetical protein
MPWAAKSLNGEMTPRHEKIFLGAPKKKVGLTSFQNDKNNYHFESAVRFCAISMSPPCLFRTIGPTIDIP